MPKPEYLPCVDVDGLSKSRGSITLVYEYMIPLEDGRSIRIRFNVADNKVEGFTSETIAA